MSIDRHRSVCHRERAEQIQKGKAQAQQKKKETRLAGHGLICPEGRSGTLQRFRIDSAPSNPGTTTFDA